jgi:RNA polymerase sigma factor (sigma-70 family)
MMSSAGSVTHWIREIKAGAEGEAQQKIWEHYFERLVALARTKLGDVPTLDGAEDVALVALNSFFVRAPKNRFPQLRDRTGLWPLLATITARKAVDAIRRATAEQRDVSRNVSLEDIVGEEPSAEFAASVWEGANQLLDELGDETLRNVAKLKLEGYTNREITQQLDISLTGVERKLRMIRKQLSEQEGD